MLKTLALTTFLSFGVAITACSSPASKKTLPDVDLPNLELAHGFLLNWNGETAIEPSGLAICQEKLLMVSDDHPHSIFEIEFDPPRAFRNEMASNLAGKVHSLFLG